MSGFWQTAVNNPKTTISGVLSFIAITSTTLIAFVSPTNRYVFGGLAIASALSRAYMGAMQKDAGVVTAITPGDAVPKVVPSTEVPLDKSNKVVKP